MPESQIVMQDARIIFRNFAGKEGMYNREGDRTFAVLLDPPLARRLTQDGWNVKFLRPREDGEEPQAYLPVSVSYKGRPPHVVLVSSRGRTDLSEHEVEILDWADMRTVDLIVRPYAWTVNEKSGIKAYLKSIFVTIEEDELELKYADLEDLPSRSGKVRE